MLTAVFLGVALMSACGGAASDNTNSPYPPTGNSTVAETASREHTASSSSMAEAVRRRVMNHRIHIANVAAAQGGGAPQGAAAPDTGAPHAGASAGTAGGDGHGRGGHHRD